MKVALIFNAFFSNVVNNLNIERNDDILNDNITDLDPVHKAINKYDKHPSILKINEVETNKQEKFSFQPIELESIIQEMLALDTSKASPKDSIPPKIIKDNCDIFSKKLFSDFNFSVTSGIHPDNLKYVDVSPAFKKGDHLDKENY